MTAGKVVPLELAALARGDLPGAIRLIAARTLAWDHAMVHAAGGICDCEVMQGVKVPADYGRCRACSISVLPGQCPGCHGVVEPPAGKESTVPLYDLICDAGHVEERLCSAAAALEPGRCRAPSDEFQGSVVEAGGPRTISIPCGKPLKRRLSVPAPIFPGADRWRK